MSLYLKLMEVVFLLAGLVALYDGAIENATFFTCVGIYLHLWARDEE